MALILSDQQVKLLIGKVILNGDESLINPNGIELRLGDKVLFHSTNEEKAIESGMYLKVISGETCLINSYEILDFRKDVVQSIFPGKMLMALVTPTTTMMREGISQVTTKVDAGFRGCLNWAISNTASKDLILESKEPLFKMTFFLLEDNESPVLPYGSKQEHTYQNSEGIMRSTRRIGSQIPINRFVESGFSKLDPKTQLQQAGYPFNYIGNQLVELHGKFEKVSDELRGLKNDFDQKANALENQIKEETKTLKDQIGATEKSLLEKIKGEEDLLFHRIKSFFDTKINKTAAVLFSALTIGYGVLVFVRAKNIFTPSEMVGAIFLLAITILVITFVVFKNGKSNNA